MSVVVHTLPMARELSIYSFIQEMLNECLPCIGHFPYMQGPINSCDSHLLSEGLIWCLWGMDEQAPASALKEPGVQERESDGHTYVWEQRRGHQL